MANKPLQTGFTRVFLIAGRARGDHKPEYSANLKMSGLAQTYGDITKIEIPDENEYGKYVEADRIRGAIERATFQLIGRFAAAVKSRLVELARIGCAVDVQLHVGECTDPSNFNVFTKALIAEDSVITGHSTDDLGALESGENAVVNETADISARDYYEVVPLSFATRAGDIIINHVHAVAIYDSVSCGTCVGVMDSDGCKKVFAVTDSAGGSPGTSPDILYSLDGGVTWAAHDVDTLTSSQNASGVAGMGDYVVVTSAAAVSYSYALVNDFVNGIDPVFTEVTTGFAGARGPNAIWSLGRKAYMVGDYGYVYFTDDLASGVTVKDAGAATTSVLNAVHAFDDKHVVAVGNDGAVIYSKDGSSFDVTTTKPVGTGTHLTGVWMKSAQEWWVSTSNGYLYYTLNSGTSWTRKTMPGTAPTKMNDVKFSTSSIGFASGIVSSKARMYRTFDGGYSWVVLSESTGSIPNADELLQLAVCKYDPNLVVGVGIHDDATDGVIITGRP